MYKKIRLFAPLAALTLMGATSPKNCDELKKEISDKLDAKGVKHYTLDVVANADVKDGAKVVGTCEGGTKKIVYTRQ